MLDMETLHRIEATDITAVDIECNNCGATTTLPLPFDGQRLPSIRRVKCGVCETAWFDLTGTARDTSPQEVEEVRVLTSLHGERESPPPVVMKLRTAAV